jgi:flagellar basal body rod protein FlgG
MSEILAIALNSMQNDMRQVEHVAMNLANTLTPGYKRQRARPRHWPAPSRPSSTCGRGQ